MRGGFLLLHDEITAYFVLIYFSQFIVITFTHSIPSRTVATNHKYYWQPVLAAALSIIIVDTKILYPGEFLTKYFFAATYCLEVLAGLELIFLCVEIIFVIYILAAPIPTTACMPATLLRFIDVKLCVKQNDF